MRKFKLKFKYDADDMNPKILETDRSLKAGDAVELEDGFWYGVMEVRILKRDIQLILSKSSQSASEAKLVMKQLLSD